MPSAVYDSTIETLINRVNALEARLREVERRDVAATSASGTANALALRDSNGGGVFDRLNIGSATGAATGQIKASGAIQSDTSFYVPRASGSALYSIDSGVAGSTMTIANNGTATPFATNLLRGLLFCWDSTDGVGALYFCDSGGTSIISDRAGIFSTTATTASKVNIYNTGGALTVENKRGFSITISVSSWKLA